MSPVHEFEEFGLVSLGVFADTGDTPSLRQSWARQVQGTDMAVAARRMARLPAIVVGIKARSAVIFEQGLARSWLRRVEAKAFVFTEGDPSTYIYQIETGAVALYKVFVDGRRQIVGFAHPGDFIGLGTHDEHLMNAQAIKPTRLRCLPVATLSQLAARDPRIGFKLYEALARDLAVTRDLVITMGRHRAIERVVTFLLAFSHRHQKAQAGGYFDLPMTRTDIGNLLGLTVETVSRTFTKLKMLGLIELPCAHHVRLVDIEQLQSIADGEEGALRTKPMRLRRLPCRGPRRA